MRQICSAFAALAAISGAGLVMVSCGPSGPQRAPWRDEAELACLRSGAVVPSAKIVPAPSLGDYGPCGVNHPFKVSELPQSRVAFSKPTTMTCQMIPTLDNWLANVVQPAAVQSFGTYVAEVETVGTYSCRRIAGSGSLSEHSYANAIDISAFKLADGRRIKVGEGFVDPPSFAMSAPRSQQMQAYAGNGMEEDRVREEWEQVVLDALDEEDAKAGGPAPYQTASNNFVAPPQENEDQSLSFLDAVRRGACSTFTTVLGPGERDHDDHLHFDLARRMSGKKICK